MTITDKPAVGPRYHPSKDEFRRLAGAGNLVAIYREAPADLETPVSAFIKLKQATPGGCSFLLESVEKGEQVGRYSFLGAGLAPLVRFDGDKVSGRDGVAQARGTRDPLQWLEELMGGQHVAEVPGLPAFWGGVVGYLSYDVVRSFERLPDHKRAGLDLPEGVFMMTERAVLFDHVKQKMQIVVLAHVDEKQADARYDEAVAEIEKMVAALAAPVTLTRGGTGGVRETETSNQTREQYMASVEKAREHIRAGDIFQVVLSQRLTRRTSADAMSIYRALRMLNPSPYMFYLDFEDFQLIGSSPEMLVKLEGGQAETRPIAGTRHRGEDEEADRALAAELLADPKERAEHIMLVDLGRNDLGRVCEYGSVRVPTLMEIEKYSHVMHIVSSVKGKLQQGRAEHPLDVVRACFPAGTLSGAPKIRAMEIIEDLEPERRGPYGGAVGYFGFNGDLNTCITIRTVVMKGDRVYLQAGAGLVADSDAAVEYEETLNKIKALRLAVDRAEEGLE